MARDIDRVIKREVHLNALSYTMIVALIVVAGVLLYSLLANLHVPDFWLLNNDVFRTVVTGLLLMLILYMVDEHNRLRAELRDIHSDLEAANVEIQAAYERLAFAHRTAEIMSSLTEDHGLEQVLRESARHFEADAAAVVGDEVTLFTQENVDDEAAQKAVMRVALDAVRAGKSLALTDSVDGSSALAVPLRVQGQLRSVCALWRAEGAFSADKLEGLQLVGRIIEMSIENRQLLDGLRDQLKGTIEALAHLVELRQPDYVHHTMRMSDHAVGIGLQLGLSEHELRDLRLACVLHDVGMLEVPAEILTARRPLTAEETMLVRRHPVAGANIAKTAHFSVAVQQAILSHHERLDGSGYPAGLAGEQIPIAARIVAVADAYNAMLSDRPYRPALSPDQAVREVVKGAGTAFDPRVVSALLTVLGRRPSSVALNDPQTRVLLEQAQ